MNNDFEGFIEEDTLNGKQVLIQKHMCGLPLPWPETYKNTKDIMECVISSIEISLYKSESDTT